MGGKGATPENATSHYVLYGIQQLRTWQRRRAANKQKVQKWTHG